MLLSNSKKTMLDTSVRTTDRNFKREMSKMQSYELYRFRFLIS